MPLEWPLPIEDFFQGLPIQSISFRLSNDGETSRTGDGAVIRHKRGARLWRGSVEMDIDDHFYWAAFEAKLAVLQEPGASFLISDIRLPGPIADPDLTQLGTAQPKLDLLSGALGAIQQFSPFHEIVLDGLPVGYELRTGDAIGFQYGSNPVRYAYHRIFKGSVADGSGRTGLVTVIPAVRPGVSPNAPVTLQQPVVKAVLQTAEYGATSGQLSEGGRFEWVQTLS